MANHGTVYTSHDQPLYINWIQNRAYAFHCSVSYFIYSMYKFVHIHHAHILVVFILKIFFKSPVSHISVLPLAKILASILYQWHSFIH